MLVQSEGHHHVDETGRDDNGYHNGLRAQAPGAEQEQC
jgi:hypothetical protein